MNRVTYAIMLWFYPFLFRLTDWLEEKNQWKLADMVDTVSEWVHRHCYRYEEERRFIDADVLYLYGDRVEDETGSEYIPEDWESETNPAWNGW